jgi:hypothetical protein
MSNEEIGTVDPQGPWEYLDCWFSMSREQWESAQHRTNLNHQILVRKLDSHWIY